MNPLKKMNKKGPVGTSNTFLESENSNIKYVVFDLLLLEDVNTYLTYWTSRYHRVVLLDVPEEDDIPPIVPEVASKAAFSRWVPPSSVRRDAINATTTHDVTFRKVRSILNKLTPEKFDKLCLDVLNVGIDSQLVLKGIILLIFEKALEEPKFSSLYAQLCHRLSDDVPNFDPPNSNTVTFRRLLLSKCQDEFENRSKAASEAFDKSQSEEDEDSFQYAKRKMLGNIKFIGELGKLRMLPELILHRCIKQLLEKKKNMALADMGEDLECLCQIMQTVGRILDHDKAKALMDQYFTRMKSFMQNQDLPPRIRFMLQDTIELRDNKWVPRNTGKDQKLRTIMEIRQDAAKDLGYFLPPSGSRGMHSRTNGFDDSDAMMDMFSGIPQGVLANSGIGTGPGVIREDSFNGRYSPQMGNRGRGNQNNPGYQYNKRQDGNSPKQQRHLAKRSPQQQQQPQQLQQKQLVNGRSDLPPRFQKKSNHTKGDSGDKMGPGDEISLRPAMKFTPMFKPGTPNMLPKSAQAPPGSGPLGMGHMLDPSMNPLLQKQQPITIKQVPAPDKVKKEVKKAPSREELRELTATLLTEFLTSHNLSETVKRVRELNAPKKYLPEMLTYFITQTLEKSDSDRDDANKLMSKLKTEGVITSDQYMEAFQSVLDKMKALEVDVPLVKSFIARCAAHAVATNVVPLVEMKEPMEEGAYYPLFMLVLQQLHKLKDEQWLRTTFNESKINLHDMLPESDRSKERMMEILEDRGLSFMFPLLRVQNELWRYVLQEPSGGAIHKWIKDNVDASLLTEPGLIYTVALVLLKYVCQESSLSEAADRTCVPDKCVTDKEKQLLLKYKWVLQMLTSNDHNLQLMVLYALQVHCHTNQFPKGLILRFFMNFYDMEIIDEEVFLRWKEEINDEYPGKGKALFQVHQWLTWLELAEEESEEDDED